MVPLDDFAPMPRRLLVIRAAILQLNVAGANA
jgi:hypothetical protein